MYLPMNDVMIVMIMTRVNINVYRSLSSNDDSWFESIGLLITIWNLYLVAEKWCIQGTC
jgi:hypothetical protein